MSQEPDFSKGKRGAVIPKKGKTRVTMYLDDDVIDYFKGLAESQGVGYQTLINQTLKSAGGVESVPVTVEKLRQVLREELAH